jgi:hypothetical protein
MPAKLRLYDCRLSRLPGGVGLCQADIPGIANYVNSAQRRLLMCKEAGDEGWIGCFAEVAFTVSRATPYLTLNRHIARLELANVCNNPVEVNSQFLEYLQYGNGRLPKTCARSGPCLTAAFTRNNVPTFVDLTNPPQIIRVYLTDSADVGKRVLIQGTDNNGKVIRSIDTYNPVQGIFVNLQDPFADLPTQMNSITGIQKDTTIGEVQFFQVDPTTGDQVLLLTMEPSEEVASYRRYYFHDLPRNCCQDNSSNVTATGIVKLELVPVRVDTDYCLIQNLEAIIEECASVRYSELDSQGSKQLSRERHNAAIGFLNGELNHYLGKDKPAVSFKPFGSADLCKQAIGRLF